MVNSGLATDFASTGAQIFKGVIRPCIDYLEATLAPLPKEEAGVRLHGLEALQSLLASDGCIGAVAATALGTSARPVRAVLFNKSRRTNWSLGWHQDRTICVRARQDAPGFGPWTVKSGMVHVAPPYDLLTRMVTVRAHLDDVPATNAPLLIALGSHTCGRIAVEDVDEVVSRCRITVCTAEAGDIWLSPRLSSMHRRQPQSRRAGGCSKSILRPKNCLTDLNGLASDACFRPNHRYVTFYADA